MAARVFLVMLLLLHPLRGVMALASPGAQGPGVTEVCGGGGDCCPLCATLDACPCADDREPPAAPEPVTAPRSVDWARVIPSGAVELIDMTSDAAPAVRVASARAPPGVARTVGDFLSVVCVWTT